MDAGLTAEVLDLVNRRIRESVQREVAECLEGSFAGMKEEALRNMEMMLTMYRKCTERITSANKDVTSGAAESEEPQLWYRNISYGDEASRPSKPKRLAVFDGPDCSKVDRARSMFFGDMLPVKSEHVLPDKTVWLQLGKGATASGVNAERKWVLAEFQSQGGQTIRQCARLTGLEEKGRPQPEEYAGQDFGRMFTEGYDGQQDVTLLSASGQAFWKPINITCLLRNIGTSTVFEKGWANSLDAFDAWVPHYAVNVYRYGLAGKEKALCVTVKPTADWSRYAGADGATASLDEVVKDLGRAQQAECKWLGGALQKLGFQWSDVRFFTAQSFLKRYGHWTVEDCAWEALQQLCSVGKNFSNLDLEAMHSDLFAQIFCLEEAFDCSGRDLQEDLQVPKADRVTTKLSGCGLPPHPSQRQLTKKELEPLRGMRDLWMKRKKERDGVLTKLGLPNTSDADVLICRHALHLVAGEGHVEVAKAIVATLHASAHRSSCLMRLDPSGKGQTPLHVAAHGGHANVLRVFVDEAMACHQLPQLLLSQDSNAQTALGVATKEAVDLLSKEVKKLAASKLKAAGLLTGDLAAVVTELQTSGFTRTELTTAGFANFGSGHTSLRTTFSGLRFTGYKASDLKGGDFTATELREAAYLVGELQAGGYADTEILAAGYAAHDLRKAGYMIGDVKRANYPDQQIRAGGYTVQDFKGVGDSDRTIRDAGFTFKDLKTAGFSGHALRAVGFGVKDFKESGVTSSDLEIRDAGFTVEDFMAAGSSDKTIRAAGFTVSDLRAASDPFNAYSVSDFKRVGYSDREIRESGFTVKDFKAANYSDQAIRTLGFTVRDFEAAGGAFNGYTVPYFKRLGFSDHEIRAAGYSVDTIQDFIRLGVSDREIRAAGFSVNDFRGAGYADRKIRSVGYTIEDFKAAGSSDSEIRAAGFSVKGFKAKGYTLQNFKAAGYSDREIRDAGCTINDFRSAGFHNYTVLDFKQAGYSDQEIRAAGYCVMDFDAAGYEAWKIRAAGYTASDFQAACFSDMKIKAAGFTFQDFRRAHYSDKRIRELGFTLSDFKAAGYSGRRIRDAGFTIEDFQRAGCTDRKIRAAGYSVRDYTFKEFRDLGFSDNEIRTAGYGVTEFWDAGCSDAEIKAAGFTVRDFKQVGYGDWRIRALGYSVQDFRAAGSSAVRIRDAGYTVEDFQRAGSADSEIRAAGYTVWDFRAAGYSDSQIRAVGYTDKDFPNRLWSWLMGH